MQQTLLASNTSKADFSLREGSAGLFRQKWIIASVFMVVILAVAAVTWLLPNRYESRMKILVKNSRADVIVSPEQTSNMTLTGEVSEAQVNSEIELAQSRDLLEAVVKKTGLAKQYLKNGQDESPIALEKAIRQLEKDLIISPVKKANIIDISYSSYSAQQSASVLGTLAELYLERHLQVHHIPGTDEFFKSQAAESGQRLLQAEMALATFEAKNNIVSFPLQKEMGLKQVIDAETDLQATEILSHETAQRIDKIKQQVNALDDRIPTQRKSVPYQYSIERMNTMLVELGHKRTQLLTRFQPEDRLVKEIDQQIADTLAALVKVGQEQSVEQTSDVNPLRQTLELELARAQTELIAKQARRNSLSKQVVENRTKLSNLEGTELKHAELESQVKELKDNYQLFAKKRDESLITAALDKQKISNVSIAETPSAPSLPSSPNRKLNLLLGLFLAAFLGIGSGIGAEFLRDTVYTPRELEGIGKYPVLATVPYRALGSENDWDVLLPGPDKTDRGYRP
ncbi:MAG: Wzz/FepE/Etk N-terminal domain-containing protein [Acidobacteriota bacterium]